jgi:hypothetical protein
MIAQFNSGNLNSLSDSALHDVAMSAAQNHKTAEAKLVSVLEIVEQKQIYLEFGIVSLYKYCVEILDLSKGVSYELVAVIHKGKEVPAIKEAVKRGEISLSKAKKICSVITLEDQNQWLELAKVETSRVIEKCVALARPEKTVESAVYKTEDRLQFQLGVSEEWLTDLATVKNLLAQKHKSAVSSEEALHALMKDFIQKNDPVRKAERALERASKRNKAPNSPNQQCPGTAEAELSDSLTPNSASPTDPLKRRKRQNIKRITLHAVSIRDRNQCTYVGTHGRCGEKRWLDIHHVLPVADGGNDDPENLTTLCRRHHVRHHSAHHSGVRSSNLI